MIDERAEIAGEETLTTEDLAAIEAMKSATPDQRANAGEEPPTDEKQEELPLDDKKPAAKAEGEGDDDDEDDEVVITGADGKPRDAKGQFVPKSALLRVKESRKVERAAREAAEQRAIRAETRFATVAEIIDAQPDPDALPNGKAADKSPWDETDIDENTDPLGALRQYKARAAYDRKQSTDAITALKGQVEETQRAGANRNTEMAVYEAFKRDVASFQSKEPAFEAALGHLVTTWKGHMKLMGETDEAKIDAAVAQTQRGILHRALANKQSPSKIMFEMATSMGFKPEAKVEDDGKPKVSDAAKRIQKTQDDINKNRTLSGAGGGALSEDSQKSRLLAMDDDEFADYIKTIEGKATLRKLGMLG